MRGEKKHVPYTAMETNTATKLTLIARKASERKTEKFTSLMHLLNAEYLYESYTELKKKKAAGIDGRTVESYSEQEIKEILTQTAKQIQQKKYRPKPVRRVDIAKENGKKRTLGIPTVIDKVVQQAITKILQAIYEPNLLEVSYGYRPGRDAHSGLKAVNHMIMQKKINWIIDADISGYFENIDHGWMKRCLDQRIADPNFKRLIQRFLKAGIMQESIQKATTKGTPQGGIISPVLANIYLHYVLDVWFEKREKKQQTGYAELIRYADDFVIGVQHQREANQIQTDLQERLKQFGLTLSEEKTKVIEFGRFAAANQKKRKNRKPATFDFLGFTHYCATTRDGRYQVRVETSRKKLTKAVTGMEAWIKGKRNREQLKDIWPKLQMKLQGHYNYYGISGNIEGIKRYYEQTQKILYKWMNRRSQKKTWNWEGFERYLTLHPLTRPKITYAIYHTW